jgi:hypothetical protein
MCDNQFLAAQSVSEQNSIIFYFATSPRKWLNRKANDTIIKLEISRAILALNKEDFWGTNDIEEGTICPGLAQLRAYVNPETQGYLL